MADKKFIPVTGNDENIQNLPKVPGYVYFAKDTGRIYYDIDSENRIPMGGSGVVIHYGKIPSDLEPETLNTYSITLDMFEDSKVTPQVEDLILNSDGTFYRITDFDGDQIFQCVKVLVSGGSGGGSIGGGGGTSIGQALSLIVKRETDSATVLNGQSVPVTITATSPKDVSGVELDQDIYLSYTIAEYINNTVGTIYRTGSLNDLISGDTMEYDFGPELRENTSSVIIISAISGSIEKPRTQRVYVTTSRLELTESSTFSNLNVFYNTERLTLSCNAIGNMNKILEVSLDGELIGEPIYLSPTAAQAQSVSINGGDARLTHGVHKVKFELFQDINSNKHVKGLSVDPIEVEIAVVDRQDTRPIIWLGGYEAEYKTYDDIQIPYKVYNNGAEEATVYFYKNNQKVGYYDIKIGSKFELYEIADADELATNYYAIGCGEQENEVRRDITFTVVEDTVHSMVNPQKNALLLNFDARGRSNNETAAQREKWIDPVNGESAIFSDFNWNNNGWIMDGGQTCLRISNGASVKIPLKSAITFNGGANTNTSNSFDFQFKIRNVKDYSSLIKNVTRYASDTVFYDEYIKNYTNRYASYDSFLGWYLIGGKPNDENKIVKLDNLSYLRTDKIINLSSVVGQYSNKQSSSNVQGFCIGPQDVFFSNGTSTVSADFVENQMVFLSIVYDGSKKDSKGKLTPLMYIYVNGVLTGVTRTDLSDSFTINDNYITFSSDVCDIDLYKVRAYNVALSVNDVVMNYAIDNKDITTYEQNGLAEYNNAIQEYRLSYGNVIQYNNNHPRDPLMPYVIFDTRNTTGSNNALSWSKKIKLKIDMEFHNTPLELAYADGELEDLAKKDFNLGDSATPEQRAEAVKQYYLHHCPSFKAEGVQIAVQGTSSEFYPRRNYKVKTKTDDGVMMWVTGGPFAADFNDNGTKRDVKAAEGIEAYKNPCHTDWFYMNNYTNGTTKFTMKVDYMESSGTYNMGLANIVRNAYSKQPLQDYVNAGVISNETKLRSTVPGQNGAIRWEDYRTSVQGYPVMAFQRYGDNDEDVRFIGLYRMLTDKGSDELYGFKPDKSITQLAMKPKVKKLTNADGSPVIGDDGQQETETTYPKVRDIAECWEFSDNNRGYCSFRDPWNREELSFKPSDYKEDGTPTTLQERMTANYAPIVADSFEYRYSKYDDALDEIYEIGPKLEFKALSDSTVATLKDAFGDDLDTTSIDAIHEAFYKSMANYEKVCAWVWLTNTENVISGGAYTPIVTGNFYELADKQYTLVAGGSELDKNKTYYHQVIEEIRSVVNDKEKISTEITYQPVVMDKDKKYYQYTANKFYTLSSLGDYTLSSDTNYDSMLTYYAFAQNTDEQMDALIAQGKSVAKHTKKLTERYTEELHPGYLTEDGYAQWDTSKKYKYDTQEFRNEKFTHELQDHFDIEYLATYFVITEVLECYDSRGKNCMMASWGPQKEGGDYIWYPIFYDMDTQLGINNTGLPSFSYDVDATDEGNFSTSDSLLWNNFYKNYKSTAILEKYKHLKGVDIKTWPALANPVFKSVAKLEKWYEADPDECNNIAMRGQRPLVAKNLDEYWKYITITNNLGLASDNTDGVANTTGYQTSGEKGEYGFDDNGTYFYALQGDRSLSRQQFLTNRFEYIDSWLNQGDYQRGGNNRIRGRVSANYSNNDTHEWYTSDHWMYDDEKQYWVDQEFGTKTHDFDSQYWLTLQPARKTYVTIGGDANSTYPSQKYDGVPINYTIQEMKDATIKSNLAEKLLYVYGMNQMASAGDLYKNYWTEFYLEGNFDKLNSLLLGCDGLMYTPEGKVLLDADGDTSVIEKDGKYIRASGNQALKAHRWYNNKMNLPTMPSSGLPLLEEANFSNLNVQVTDPTLNLAASEKLKDFRATGSNFSQITFADGVALNTLYLPASITRINLVQTKLLNNIVESYAFPQLVDGKYVAEPGLYVEQLTDLTDDTDIVTNVSYLRIIGDAMGYDSYKLLKKFYQSRSLASSNSSLEITDVVWTPYKKLIVGNEFDKEVLAAGRYFKDNGHYGFTQLASNYNFSDFNNDVANGELYILDKDFNEEEYLIKDISMFEALMDDDGKFKSTSGQGYPSITGDLYIANANAIDEIEVRKEFNVKFPKLNVFFKNVNPSKTMKFVVPDLDDNTNAYLGTYSYVPLRNGSAEKSVQKYRLITEFQNPYAMYNPNEAKPNYDFICWSTSLDPYDTESYIGESGLAYDKDNLATHQDNAWKEFLAKHADDEQTDFVIYALFKKHYYNMYFYNGPYDTNPRVESAMYGTKLGDVLPNLMFIHPDESSLGLYESYKFIGFTQTERVTNGEKALVVADEKSAALVNMDMLSSVQDYKFYAVYKKINVHDGYDEKTDAKKFVFTQYTYPDEADKEYNIIGYQISPAQGVSLSGKITLPVTAPDGLPVVAIAGFGWSEEGYCNGITHIFWNTSDGDNPSLRFVLPSAFENIGLQFFEFPSNLRMIGKSAFYRANNFATMQHQDAVDLFGKTKIYAIAEAGLQNAFSLQNCERFIVPGTISRIGAHGITFLDPTFISMLQIGTESQPSILRECGEGSSQGIRGQNSNGRTNFNEVTVYAKTGQFSAFTDSTIGSAIRNIRDDGIGHTSIVYK